MTLSNRRKQQVALLLASSALGSAFLTPLKNPAACTIAPTCLSATSSSHDAHTVNKILATASLVTALAINTPLTPANAYSPSDYASDTVQDVLTNLKAASGNVDQTFKVYEDINAIITEGKGVGGDVNYKGVQLNRGYVADEDTSVYNPGLTLLTESEKERLTEAVVQARTSGLKADSWNEDAELGFQFLREKLDPLHMMELKGYLKFVPALAAVVYLAVLAVQQNLRDLFPVAYFIGVGVIFGPAIALILAGP